jgi:hypothetical protein
VKIIGCGTDVETEQGKDASSLHRKKRFMLRIAHMESSVNMERARAAYFGSNPLVIQSWPLGMVAGSQRFSRLS